MEKLYHLPRPYLSYSAYSLWNSSKDAFRRRYYLNEKPFETVETIFGKTQHKVLEESGEVNGSETRMEVTIDGLKLMGYIDSLDDKLKIIDFKFSHISKEGKVPWDKVKVYKHKQLVFYSMMVKEKHGKFHPTPELHWIETRFKRKSVEFDGHIIESESRELELTGRVEIFKRRVYKWEIEVLKQEVLRAAKEISEDYSKFLEAVPQLA